MQQRGGTRGRQLRSQQCSELCMLLCGVRWRTQKIIWVRLCRCNGCKFGLEVRMKRNLRAFTNMRNPICDGSEIDIASTKTLPVSGQKKTVPFTAWKSRSICEPLGPVEGTLTCQGLRKTARYQQVMEVLNYLLALRDVRTEKVKFWLCFPTRSEKFDGSETFRIAKRREVKFHLAFHIHRCISLSRIRRTPGVRSDEKNCAEKM